MSERAFKVGDRVRVAKDATFSLGGDVTCATSAAGKEAVVERIRGDGHLVLGGGRVVSPQFCTLIPEPEAGEILLPARTATLRAAEGLVNGDRQEEYGTPAVNLGRIAALWSVIFAREVTKSEVALALACLKVARLVQTPGSRDGWTDLAGYAAIGAEVSES